jgi:hypothetical protein
VDRDPALAVGILAKHKWLSRKIRQLLTEIVEIIGPWRYGATGVSHRRVASRFALSSVTDRLPEQAIENHDRSQSGQRVAHLDEFKEPKDRHGEANEAACVDRLGMQRRYRG